VREIIVGVLDKAEILKDNRDIDGGIGRGKCFLKPLFEVQQR